MTSLGNCQQEDFLTYGPWQHLLTIRHKMMCYASIHVCKTKAVATRAEIYSRNEAGEAM